MTLLGRLLSFFPTLHIACIGFALCWTVLEPSWIGLLTVPFTVYGLPLCANRIHQLFHPVEEGIYRLDEKRHSPWWGAHQFQALFIAVPPLEGILQLVPGLFSLWLRLWGSSVGKDVYWTPRVEIIDRNLMEVGDRVLFGHHAACYGHAVRRKNGRLMLYVRKVRFGDDVFIGAYSRIGPGVKIESGSTVPIGTDLYPNQTFQRESGHSHVVA